MRMKKNISRGCWSAAVMMKTTVALVVLLAVTYSKVADAKAILGVDLGTLYMKVALVQRGAPLEIVTNFHSKRKTEQMILFDAGTRFYGADASSLLARKPQKTPVQMTLMLGRDEEHPCVKALNERHFPVTPTYNETRSGLAVSVDNQDFTPEELVAMVLHHAKDMTQAYVGELGKDAQAAPRDCVLTVPAFSTVHERRALLDAAQLADLNVLGLLEENTAAALHYSMDKQFPDPQLFVFYNMGGTAVQVSVVRLHNYNITSGLSSKAKTVGALEVLSKAWDSTLGGQSFDHRIVEFLADEFNAQWDKQRKDGQKKDIRSVPRAMTKLRLQANKVKHVLSANMEIPIYMDSLYDDCSLQAHITRAKLEELCADLFERATKPVYKALEYANKTLDEVDGIEMIGGGMRIPRIQTDLKKALNDIELGMHINADESMALGAAFYGANISTAFRVRHVGLLDVNPFPITITLKELVEEEEAKKGFFGGGKKKKEEKDGDAEEEEWGKHATILKAFGKLGVKKTIAFTHDKDIYCALDYEESDILPEGTPLSIERFNITGVADFAKEMDEKELGKPKVSLQFKLMEDGITRLLKAEATVEETYTMQEEVEVDDDVDGGNATNTTEAESTEGEEDAKKEDDEKADATAEERKLEKDANTTESEDGANETEAASANATTDGKKGDKKPKKKKKTVVQEKEKKRIHKRTLTVKAFMEGKAKPYSPELLEESKAKLLELARKDKLRVMLEAAKNKVESYIYYIKNKLIDDEDKVNKVSIEEQRAHILKLAEDAEEWMYEDGAHADLATTEDKYAELSVPAEKIFDRVKETTARPEAIEALKGRLEKVGELMKKWETSMTHITEEERGDVLAKVEEVKAWIAEKEEAQSKVEAHEDPAFTSAEVPGQMRPIEVLVAKLKKKPKPKPPKKNETDANVTDADATDTNATDAVADADADADTDSDASASEREGSKEDENTGGDTEGGAEEKEDDSESEDTTDKKTDDEL